MRWRLARVSWSKCASAWPEPKATHVSGDSAEYTGIPVSAATSSGKPRISVPPPARRMPSRAMSQASSGGVSSSVSRTACMISRAGPWIAALTSSLRSSMAVGRPVTRCRPRTSTAPPAAAAAEPIAILIGSAVRDPIASWCPSAGSR